MATASTHVVRSFELQRIIRFINKNNALLEIGAGDGWQAKQLSEYCNNVYAIDIENDQNSNKVHFPVKSYDGSTIPFENSFFDIIYSSNVLEHIVDIDQLQNEMWRVLKPDGIAIHCVPSSTWRIWTSIGHPIYMVKLIIKLIYLKFIRTEQLESTVSRIKKTSWPSLFRLMLISARHGEHGSMLSEIRLFSRKKWTNQFSPKKWEIIYCEPSNIFYTGNEIFGKVIGINYRSRMSQILGSSTHIFVARKKQAPISHHNK